MSKKDVEERDDRKFYMLVLYMIPLYIISATIMEFIIIYGYVDVVYRSWGFLIVFIILTGLIFIILMPFFLKNKEKKIKLQVKFFQGDTKDSNITTISSSEIKKYLESKNYKDKLGELTHNCQKDSWE